MLAYPSITSKGSVSIGHCQLSCGATRPSRLICSRTFRQAELLAAGDSNVLHGLRRNVWHRRHRSWGGLRRGDPHPADHATAVEPANRADEWPARELNLPQRRSKIFRCPGQPNKWTNSGQPASYDTKQSPHPTKRRLDGAPPCVLPKENACPDPLSRLTGVVIYDNIEKKNELRRR